MAQGVAKVVGEAHPRHNKIVTWDYCSTPGVGPQQKHQDQREHEVDYPNLENNFPLFHFIHTSFFYPCKQKKNKCIVLFL